MISSSSTAEVTRGEAEERWGSQSTNPPHATYLSVSQMISSSSTAEVTRGAVEESEVLNQSIHLMTLTCLFHRWYPPRLQQRWQEEQQRRDVLHLAGWSGGWHTAASACRYFLHKIRSNIYARSNCSAVPGKLHARWTIFSTIKIKLKY